MRQDHQREVAERKAVIESARKCYDTVTDKIDKLVEGWIDRKIPETIYERKLA